MDEDAAGNADSTEAELKHIVPNKIHVRGLDTFAPNDVKAYVAQHQAGQFERVEWIDDTSANLVYPSESGAQEALVKLAAVPIADVTQLPPLESIPAKEYASKPDSVLQVRFAVAGDKKAANAAARSRFYLLHPEHDPEERRRRGEFDRKRYRDRDGDYSRDQRRDGNRRRPRFDYDDEEKQFDVTLYDDNAETRSGPRAVSRSRQRSDSVSTRSSESDRVRFQADKNRNKELFPNWQSRKARSRDRSASPTRSYGRGNHEADLDESTRAAAAARTREKARAIKERLSRENKSRELFPGKDVKAKELFPSMVGSSSGGRAQMDQVEDSSILTSGMSRISLQDLLIARLHQRM